ncbi:MAG: ferritin-like domain-containing protein [Pseudomonadota bacterium]
MADAALAAARAVLTTAEPAQKAAAAEAARAAWPSEDDFSDGGAFDKTSLPDRPARPARPPLADPAHMPRRRLSSQSGRVALLHAVAHIEFNAIDLAFDMAARFAADISAMGLDAAAFVSDWYSVGGDEARHFGLVRARLNALGADYGDLPAHDGLWEAAQSTADDVLARLAIAPMVLEARGLDVTPAMIEKLRAAGDEESAAVLQVIYEDEIGHVAAGRRWFQRVCAARGLDPQPTFQALVRDRFAGDLKPPFNKPARTQAGLPEAYYLDCTEEENARGADRRNS